MAQPTQITQDEINGILWKACDTFCGTIDPSEYKNYILVMLFVKYISDVWQDHYDVLKQKHGDDEEMIRFKLRHERFVLPEGCRFADLYAQRNAVSVGEVINIALERIEEANKEKLEGVFRNIDFNSEAALGRTRQRNERMQNLLNDFADPRLDLRPSRVGNLDIIGNAYEYLIGRFAAGAGKKAGEFYTLPEVSILLARLLNPQPGDRVCDPACGSGSLLIKCAQQVGGDNYALYGQEANGATWALAVMNMFLHNVNAGRQNIHWTDTLRHPSLHPNIPNPRVIIVTDRIDLDDQIWNTFKACGKKAVKAGSGTELVALVKSRQADIITTVINKLETVSKERVQVDDPNIFVLVDESHRSQYGAIQAKMRRVFRKACYIGFTGTPLVKKDKQTTVEKFGSFIHTYSMRRAVEDGAVVPLLYEGRLVAQEVDQTAIDKWFERVTDDLSREQKLDLKRKFSGKEEVSRAARRLEMVAYDISEHYRKNFQERQLGQKSQLAAPSKRIALKYKQLLDEFGKVTSAVVISSPDTRDDNDAVDAAKAPELEAFWKRMMARYKTEEAYNREIKADFHHEDGVEILIVVDKLLTGFDEPRNTVLYVDKPLKAHSLLQAIARVNRLFEGKPYGYIIDYRGVLGEVNEAMETYTALEAYDPEDVKDAFIDISVEVAKLPQYHADLWAVFKTVSNPRDIEALQQFLAPEDRRQQFYEALDRLCRLSESGP